jgi:hypothetical protein
MADYLIATSVYVLYRIKHLDIATVKVVLMELQENNIGVS